MTLQLSIKRRQFSFLGQKCQNGIVDELLFVLRKETLERRMRKREDKCETYSGKQAAENPTRLRQTHILCHCMKHSTVGYVGIESEDSVGKISI